MGKLERELHMRVGFRLVSQLLLLVLLISHLGAGQTEPVPKLIDLKTATGLMIANNPTLQREKGTIDVARGDLVAARQLPNPSIDVSSESYPVFGSHPGPFFNRQELIIRAGQTIETAGKRGKRTVFAEKGFASTKAAFDDVLRQLTLELKSRYYGIAFAQAQYELAKELLGQFDELLRFYEARYQQGEISGLEFARLRTERLRFYSDMGSAELQLKNNRAALLELLGSPALDAEFSVAEKLTSLQPVYSIEQLQQQATANRPDLRAQAERVARENADVRLQRALAFPDITPTVGYKRDFGLNTLAIGFNLPIPLFNRNQGGVIRATAELQRQQSELIRLRLQVNREVQQAMNQLAVQTALVQQIEKDYLPSAKKVRSSALQSFRLGAIDLVTFIDADRTYRETLRSYNQALLDQHLSKSALEAAVGGDLQ
ncbi:MAG: TolC family protein [Acidobacteriales bacterium]|nr:TolC family protein [Terriglobales bacterium]